MYNIHSHYHNIWCYAKTLCHDPRVAYLHPFGSTEPENLEVLCDDRPELNYYERGPILICYDQEPLIAGFNDRTFQHVLEYLNHDDQPVILLNTEPESQDKKILLDRFGFRDCYSFFHVFAASDWYRGYRYNASITPPQKRTIRKKYITFNRLTGGARMYRSMLIAELADAGILDQGHVSYSEVCPINGHYRNSLSQASSLYNVDSNYARQCIEVLDHIKYPLRIDTTNEIIPNGSMTIGAIEQNMETFLHVVTETCYWEKKLHLTEKVFKPIIAQQPFVLLAPRGCLAYLRRYGFQTFNRWWDESYDEIDNPIHRLQAVVSIIKKISSMSNDDLKNLLVEMNDVLEHNRRLLDSGDLLDAAWKELTDNLRLCLAAPN
jgi:hypothetical protein